jgi:DNA-binding NarL/FixJ family response regulator
LAQTSERVRVKKPRGFAGFSERDLAIIELIAKGLNAEEIREKLRLSRRQIDVHLRQVARRAGFTKLEEIACWAFDNALDEPVEED